jgi:UDP-N-acetylglucosamine 2-epimerase (non-hydrolysing)
VAVASVGYNTVRYNELGKSEFVNLKLDRPEVIGSFATRVLPGPGIGKGARLVLDDVDAVHSRLAKLPSPYGDGNASQMSLEALAGLVRTVSE